MPMKPCGLRFSGQCKPWWKENRQDTSKLQGEVVWPPAWQHRRRSTRSCGVETGRVGACRPGPDGQARVEGGCGFRRPSESFSPEKRVAEVGGISTHVLSASSALSSRAPRSDVLRQRMSVPAQAEPASILGLVRVRVWLVLGLNNDARDRVVDVSSIWFYS